MKHLFNKALLLLTLALASAPQSVRACAACFGQSDDLQAKSLNFGIFALLVVVLIVLVGISAFFIYIARRSAALAEMPMAEAASEMVPETHREDVLELAGKP